MTMGGPYHGRMKLRWCMECNLPVLGGRCGICGRRTDKVQVSPPGDVRPAFERDVMIINETVEGQYGTPLIPGDKVAVLNKTSGVDRFDEVVVDGRVLGALEYDVRKQGFNFLPRLEGARRIWDAARSGKRVVEIDPSAVPYILKGASVLMPGVVSFDTDIQEGDQVIVVSEGDVIAVGKGMMSGDAAKGMEKGMFVKVRRYSHPEPPRYLRGGQRWEDAVEANSEVLEKYEEEAISFIKNVSAGTMSRAVAFSGGKDSLATLVLVRKALGQVPVMFVDTGVEVPETLSFIRDLEKRLDMEFLREEGGDFFKGVEYFGPPGRDYRWCCKVCKLGPTAKIIERHFPEGVLNFIGQRAYESETRAKSQRVWRNPWLPKQKGAGPIQHWTALHVWLYLLGEGQDTNVLYREGLERIGCWPCPASDMAEMERINELHPGMWGRWVRSLRFHGLKDEEISLGAWRWRRLPKGKRTILAGSPRERRRIFHYWRKGDRIEGRAEGPFFEEVKNLSRVFNATFGADSIEFDGVIIHRDGNFSLEGPGDPEEKLKKVFGLFERAAHCFGCGVCLGQCREGAVEIGNGRAAVKENCTSCGRCHSRCPIIRYGVERAEFRLTKGFL
jgi:phosphoadenosine phosphosulfate reductase